MQITQSASRDPALGAQADLRALLGTRCLLIVRLAHRTKKRNHYLRIAEHYCTLAEAEELKQHQDT